MHQYRRLLHWWLIIPLMLFVATVGVMNLDSDHIWIDELSSIGNIGWLAGDQYNPIEVIQSVAAKSPAHLPGYFILLSIWSTFTGWSPFTLRAFSLLLGLLAIAVTYQCGRVWLPKRTGLYPALVIGWSAYFIYYTHELRMYTQLAFFVALTLWVYGRVVWQKQHSTLNWLLLFSSTLGLIYTHVFGLLLVASIGIYHLIVEAKNRHWLYVAVVMGSAGMLFLPWLTVLLYGAERNAGWIPRNSTLSPIGILQTQLRLFSNDQTGFMLIMVALAIVGLFIFQRSAYRLWLIFIITFVIVVIFNVIMPSLPPGRVRYLMIFWPLLALLVGLGLETIQQLGSVRWALAVLTLWLAFGVATFSDPEAQPQKSSVRSSRFPPFNRIISAMKPIAFSNDLLISFSDTNAYEPGKFNSIGEFYLGPLAGDLNLVRLDKVLADDDEQQLLLDKIGSRVTVWLVSEPDLAPDVVDLYRETMTQDFTLCDVPIDDSELRIERYDIDWFECASRVLPSETLAKFGADITLHDIKLFSRVDNRLEIASAWSVGDSIPPETFSVSFKLWQDGPDHLALTDFGLRYPGESWYSATMLSDNLANGTYRLTVTVYNWKTGERLAGVYGDVVASEIPVMEFRLPLDEVFRAG